MSTASILVIDDEVGMREGCRRALTPQGYRVTVAEHGAEGLQKLRQQPFDLVLLDAMMPGMSGLELLEHLREHDPDLIIVMITGYATVDLAARAVKQGAFDFLPKPFTSDELLTSVTRGLEERRQRKALRDQAQQQTETLQLERARQEMAKIDAMQSRFMLVIAHELRNPAGVLKSYLQLMRGGFVDDDEWDEYLAKLDGRADQLLQMLDDILELAHLKQRHESEKLDPVAVADTLEDAVHRLQSRSTAKGLSLEIQLQARPHILAEQAHLQSLWANLLDNALQYTLQGEVRVTLGVQDGLVTISVADTGIGISTEELAQIFQEFYRSEAAKEVVPLGTGLGLPIVNQIVKIYGGAIRVESTPDQGSTFTISLPVDASEGG
jgi:signal transduction histidine kinase